MPALRSVIVQKNVAPCGSALESRAVAQHAMCAAHWDDRPDWAELDPRALSDFRVEESRLPPRRDDSVARNGDGRLRRRGRGRVDAADRRPRDHARAGRRRRPSNRRRRTAGRTVATSTASSLPYCSAPRDAERRTRHHVPQRVQERSQDLVSDLNDVPVRAVGSSTVPEGTDDRGRLSVQPHLPSNDLQSEQLASTPCAQAWRQKTESERKA
jgi:hypothetical protein